MPVPRGLVNVCEPERPRRMGGRDKRDGPAVALMFSAQQTTWFAGVSCQTPLGDDSQPSMCDLS